MLGRLLASTLYVKVYANRLELRAIEAARNASAVSDEPFTTARLLVGQFAVAERVLRGAVGELYGGAWFRPAPRVLIQPMEKTEGGLSEVEERVLRELAQAAGARRTVVWVGPELADHEVLARLEAS